MITVLKSKIREAVITATSTECEGSITLSPELMDKADLREFEQVHVNSKRRQGRIVTYVIRGKRGCKVELNGGAANHFKVGEVVHILSFRQIDEVREIGFQTKDGDIEFYRDLGNIPTIV